MIGHERPRTLTISLADGARIEFERRSELVKMDAAERAVLAERYGEMTFETRTQNYESEAELAAGYFRVAQTMFLRDGYHRSILLLFRDRKLIRPIEIRTDNTQQKYVVMRQLADEVLWLGSRLGGQGKQRELE
jgi:hypothetical protein